MSLHQLQARQDQRAEGPPRMRARAFFDAALPLALGAQPLGAQSPGASSGRFAFELAGEGGGSWTIDCASRAITNQLEPADVVVRMPATSFEELLRGALDVHRALQDGSVTLQGDRRALAKLAAMLAAARGAARPPLERALDDAGNDAPPHPAAPGNVQASVSYRRGS